MNPVRNTGGFLASRPVPENPLQEVLEPFVFPRRKGSKGRGIILVRMLEHGFGELIVDSCLSGFGQGGVRIAELRSADA